MVSGSDGSLPGKSRVQEKNLLFMRGKTCPYNFPSEKVFCCLKREARVRPLSREYVKTSAANQGGGKVSRKTKWSERKERDSAERRSRHYTYRAGSQVIKPSLRRVQQQRH